MYDDRLLVQIINHITNNTYPRGLGNPMRANANGYFIANNAEDILTFIKDNKYINVYLTVYGFTEYINPKVDKINAVIDRIPFDFDDVNDISNAHRDMKKWYRWCARHNIIPTITFSGKKGFHGFIFIDPIELRYPDKVIRRFVDEMNSEAKFTTLDSSVVGDLNRIIRIPGSKHKSTGRYCTFINPNEFLSYTIQDIINLSENVQEYIPERVQAPYEITAYLKQLDDIIAEEERVKAITPQEMIQGSILSNIWNPEIPRGAGVLNCIAFERAMSTGSIQGHHGDETLSGIIQKLRSDNLSVEELTKRVYEFNKLCKPPFSTSFLDYKIDYHMSNPYAPCTFFLKCGDLCKGCRKVESGQVGNV
jgi:hypothetical protein